MPKTVGLLPSIAVETGLQSTVHGRVRARSRSSTPMISRRRLTTSTSFRSSTAFRQRPRTTGRPQATRSSRSFTPAASSPAEIQIGMWKRRSTSNTPMPWRAGAKIILVEANSNSSRRRGIHSQTPYGLPYDRNGSLRPPWNKARRLVSLEECPVKCPPTRQHTLAGKGGPRGIVHQKYPRRLCRVRAITSGRIGAQAIVS